MTQGFQLSPRQKHLWQLQPDKTSQVFYSTASVLISGNLDTNALGAALATVVSSHEILRTLYDFPAAMTIPVQVIQLTADLSLPFHDLSGLSEADQDQKAYQIFGEMVQNAAIDKAPPFFAALFKLSSKAHQLRLWLPAMTADGSSLLGMVEQLAAAYETAVDGGELEIEALQYADYAEWQLGLFEDEEAQTEAEEWYRKLLSAPLDVHLPLENTPDSEEVFYPDTVSTTLKPALASDLTQLAAANNVSASTVLLAGWRILLWHLGQSELILGVGCDGRTYEELEDALGLFATTLPLPSELDGSESLPSLLTTLEDAVIEAYNSQEYFSWEQLPQVGEGDPKRHYLPIAFNYHDLENDTFILGELGDISFTVEALTARTNRYHLLLNCYHQGEAMNLRLEYDSRRFDKTEIQRLVDRLTTLLANMVQESDAEVQAFSILPDWERETLLEDFSLSQSLPPANQPVVELIGEQAVKRPEQTAVQMGDQMLTYSQLDQQANQLAAQLQSLGVGPSVPVGVLLNASPEAVVAIMAVHKAGGAYVPLDPQYPADRLAYVLEDTQTPVLITEKALAPGQSGPKVLLLDEIDFSVTDASPVTNSATLDDLAYLIYTSGSTGTPKGVAVTHGNLAHSTTTRFEYYANQPGRFLLLSSFAFDSSIVGLFWTLSQGGTVVLASSDDIRDPQLLAGVFERQAVTHTLALPSLYQLLLVEAKTEQLSSLETVVVAGESCPNSLVELHRELMPDTKLYNEYGPTEGSVWSTVYDCSTGDIGDLVPIGRPIPNTQIYILDDNQQPAPIGVPGELYIGGRGVAKGYYKRPDLTAERFLDHPFGGDGKVYRTGDLARFLPDGTIEFLGRADQQIKIRGYRVELGEIENVLGTADAVQEAVVVTNEDSQGLTQLVAYLTTNSGQTTTPQDLRQHLSQKLPPYMVPATFVILDKMPRTPNGKVNRRALPAPDGASRAASVYVAPRTALEEVLVGIWSDLLNYDKVGIEDNFFNLGGHSILVTQLVSRIRSLLPVDLPLRIIFDKPEVAELADYINETAVNTTEIEATAELLLQVANLSDAEAEAALAGE